MDDYSVLPNQPIAEDAGPISRVFSDLGAKRFHDACRYVHELPYGYNTDRDDPMILFKERKGSCTTKHAVVATLAEESGVAVEKHIGIYGMTEEIVTGTRFILEKYSLPYVPMVHCFLDFNGRRVDLTSGNDNGKNRSIEHFIHVEKVSPNISAKDEYLIYRKVLKDVILRRQEFQRADMKTVLKAREEGLSLLRSKINSLN